MAGVLVHEWIAQSGGSENVLEVMSDAYPESDIVCLWNDSSGRFANARLHESILARTPLRKSKALALPFMPLIWSFRKNRGYDWALVSSHLFAHHVRFAGSRTVRRFVYVHSPARYIWTPDLDTRGSSLPVRLTAAVFKPLDRWRARQTPEFAANSRFVKARIEKAWGIDAKVIYPPVDVRRIRSVPDWAGVLAEGDARRLADLPEGFILGASRFIPYKRLDEAIRAGELTGRPVVLAGDGPELDALRERASRASVPVTVIVAPSSPLLYALFQRCAVYVFPPIEDFGIMPVEAMAAGAAVVANAIGGAAESVIDGETGALTDFADDALLAEAVARAIATERDDRLARAEEFSTERFVTEIREWVGA